MCMLCVRDAPDQRLRGIEGQTLLESVWGAPRSAVPKVLGKGRFATFWSVWKRLRNLRERAGIRLPFRRGPPGLLCALCTHGCGWVRRACLRGPGWRLARPASRSCGIRRVARALFCAARR
eukprot:3359019-Prymnesium_polylepis.1